MRSTLYLLMMMFSLQHESQSTEYLKNKAVGQANKKFNNDMIYTNEKFVSKEKSNLKNEDGLINIKKKFPLFHNKVNENNKLNINNSKKLVYNPHKYLVREIKHSKKTSPNKLSLSKLNDFLNDESVQITNNYSQSPRVTKLFNQFNQKISFLGDEAKQKSKMPINKNRRTALLTEDENLRYREQEAPDSMTEHIPVKREDNSSTAGQNFGTSLLTGPIDSHLFNRSTNFHGNKDTIGCKHGRYSCCSNRNNTCWSHGPRINNNLSSFCFCDEACKHLSDCCTDYENVCPPVDCIMSEWEQWSECNVQCGTGVRQRIRKVIVQPQNSGKPCGNTWEMAGCAGYNCKSGRSISAILTETAKIVPWTYGQHRSSDEYNPLADIRQNIYFRRNPEEAHNFNRSSTCMTFEIVKVLPQCDSTEYGLPSWTSILKNGVEVCVECQFTAMVKDHGNRCRGEGSVGLESRWATNKPTCSGIWIRKNNSTICQCEMKNDSFIFI